MIVSVDDRLVRLATLSPADLRAEWARVHDGPPPRLSPELMRHAIAYRLQEKAAGKRGAARADLLDTAPRPRRAAPRPGTQLIRDWNGRTVSVTVQEDGFSWEGRCYPSLSAIARAVTGAHWSGPRFFGLSARG